jgi:hypothetical protein
MKRISCVLTKTMFLYQKSMSKNTFNDLLTLNMIVIVLALTFNGLMQLCNLEMHVWHSDFYIIEKSAKGVTQQALSEGSFFLDLFLWELMTLLFTNRTARIENIGEDIDGSVRPTEGLGLCSNLAHPLCRSGKAWILTVKGRWSFSKALWTQKITKNVACIKYNLVFWFNYLVRLCFHCYYFMLYIYRNWHSQSRMYSVNSVCLAKSGLHWAMMLYIL